MSKKIAFLINSMSGGGAEKLVKILIEHLDSEGYSVELICLEKNDVYSFIGNIKVTYLSDWSKGVGGIKKLIFLPILAFRLNKYITNNNIKLVQSHLFRANYVNLLVKFFRSKHEIQVINHSVISRYKKEGLSGRVNLFLIKQLYPFADKIISVSNVVEKDMQELFGFKNEKKVIYNFFDINNIQKLVCEEINEFKFDKAKKYLVSVGRLISLKRNKDLVEVLSKVDKNVELIFIGTGEKKENLRRQSNDLGLLQRIHFLGWVNNPYKYIKNADLLVCTSETESFGNVLVEAMVCGKPVLSTRCGGPEEIIEDGVNGILVDVGNIDNMVKSINMILNNKEIYNKYIKNAYLSSRKFDVRNIIKKYKKVLEIE